MGPPDRRRGEQPPAFPYERAVTVMAGGIVMALLAWGGATLVALGEKVAKLESDRASKTDLASVAVQMDGMKIGHAIEKENLERRISTLERLVEQLRNARRFIERSDP